MDYIVTFVDESELPAAQDWALACQRDVAMLFIKRNRVTEQVLERAWSGYASLANQRLKREHGLPASF